MNKQDNGFRLDRSSYIRESDGMVMIEIAPGQFVAEHIARGLPPPNTAAAEAAKHAARAKRVKDLAAGKRSRL